MPYGIVALKADIKDLEENITLRKELGKSYDFEAKLLKSWKSYLPGGRNHHKLFQPSPNQK